MAKICSSMIAALALVACGINQSSPAQAAATTQCTSTPAQSSAAIQQLEAFAARAQALTEQNPIYESDLQYYISMLADAERCAHSPSPVATVSR
jgi:hypothetical protein